MYKEGACLTERPRERRVKASLALLAETSVEQRGGMTAVDSFYPPWK